MVELVVVEIPKENQLVNHKIPGYKDTWYEIGRREYKGEEYILLESEQYGEDTYGIIVTASAPFTPVLDDVYDSWSELVDYIEEEEELEFDDIDDL